MAHRIEVKKWWYEKEQSKAQGYNWTLCWEKVFEDDDGKRYKEKDGERLYNLGAEVKVVGYALFGEAVKETDKSIQYRLIFWNLNKAGRYVTDAPVESKWLTWIPKSVLL